MAILNVYIILHNNNVIDESKMCPGITKRELVDFANSVKTLSKLVDGNYGQAIVRHEQCEQLMPFFN